MKSVLKGIIVILVSLVAAVVGGAYLLPPVDSR